MKKIYQSPEVEVMNFAAAEKLAALGLEEIGLVFGIDSGLDSDIQL